MKSYMFKKNLKLKFEIIILFKISKKNKNKESYESAIEWSSDYEFLVDHCFGWVTFLEGEVWSFILNL